MMTSSWGCLSKPGISTQEGQEWRVPLDALKNKDNEIAILSIIKKM